MNGAINATGTLPERTYRSNLIKGKTFLSQYVHKPSSTFGLTSLKVLVTALHTHTNTHYNTHIHTH